ncbi:endonuclease V isoform X3 [Calonectris borealis]|uniref:endonuclease V isoform X3 n=1 Tax=Calonectris borealis TaxID=1323832 RepID=UPI003F4C187F
MQNRLLLPAAPPRPAVLPAPGEAAPLQRPWRTGTTPEKQSRRRKLLLHCLNLSPWAAAEPSAALLPSPRRCSLPRCSGAGPLSRTTGSRLLIKLVFAPAAPPASFAGTAALRPRSRGGDGGDTGFRRGAMSGRAAEPPPDATLRRWEREQAQLKASVVEEDTEEWQEDASFTGLERVGGVDLSYIKGDDTSACASLVVLSYPALEVLYEDCRMVAVSAPYVAGFLAFREVPFLVEAVQRLQQEEPKLKPQVLLVDGNGLLHPRGFGVACHLGVLTDLPCIGVAKNLLQVDGLVRDELHREQIRSLQREGDTFPLTGTSGRVLGMGAPGDSRASSQVLLQVPDPGAHPSAEKRRLNWMISLMPEETAGLLFTGSSPPPRLWFRQVQQPSATPGESSARPWQAGQRQPLCVVLVGRQTSFSSRIMFRAYFSGLIFQHGKNICVSKGTLVSLLQLT